VGDSFEKRLHVVLDVVDIYLGDLIVFLRSCLHKKKR